MASPPSSKLRFRTRAGTPIEAPAEWAPAYLEIVDASPDELSTLEVLRQGVQLPIAARAVDGAIRVVAEWPLSDPGRYRVELIEAGARQEVIEPRIQPAKISPE